MKSNKEISHIKSADQNCNCKTHTGPHWKHMDKLWHERNLKLFEIVKDTSLPTNDRKLALLGFALEEIQRLHDKKQYLDNCDKCGYV